MIDSLDPRAFVRLVAGIWKRRGWQTKVKPRNGGTFFVLCRREDGAFGLVYVVAGDREVGENPFTNVASMAREKEAKSVTIVTQGDFADPVRERAAATGINLLGPDRLEQLVRQGGYEDLLPDGVSPDGTASGGTGGESEEGRGETAADGSADSDLPAALDPVVERLPAGVTAALLGVVASARDAVASSETVPDPLAPAGHDGGGDGSGSGDGGGGVGSDGDGGGSGSDGGDGSDAGGGRLPSIPVPISPRIAAVALLAVLLVVAASTVGTSALGGVVAGGDSTDPVAVAALSTASAENASVEFRWNAVTTERLTLANDTTFTAPEGEVFVAVAVNATPTGSAPGSVPQSDLVLQSDGTRYAYQPLSDVQSFNGGLFAPNETTAVWTVYSVPADTPSGTLVVLPDEQQRLVRFVHDPDLEVDPAA